MAGVSEKLRSKIYDAIKSSPDVKEGNYINVSIKKTGFLGFGPGQIELSGRASSEKTKERIEEIAKELAGDVEVVSTVRVGRAG